VPGGQEAAGMGFGLRKISRMAFRFQKPLVRQSAYNPLIFGLLVPFHAFRCFWSI
jgi:hypothetical protein